LLGFWWGFFLLHNIVDRFSEKLTEAAKELDAAAKAMYVDIGSDLIRVIAAVLAILVVRSVMKRQERRSAHLLYPADEGLKDDPTVASGI
jgi:hypothetical protein